VSYPPNVGAIAQLATSREGFVLAESILGTAEPRRVSEALATFCPVRLGSGVEGTFFCELSVGAAFGLRPRDGRRVMLKVHPPDWSYRFLEAVCRVQRHLFSRGFPCPEPIAGPLLFGGGFATVEAFVDDGKPADAHEPEIRRSMAHALARLIGLAADGLDAQALLQAWKPPPDRGQWPVPHNALFDFEATSAGTECIHEISSKARKILDNPPGKMVVGHADWSAKHFRFEEGRVCVIYDWDSPRLDMEINLVWA
jgi:Ser/Thr protein kinase RdoA (MazF antagonist)